MDSITPIIPSPSTGWGRLAATQGEPAAVVRSPGSGNSQRREDDAEQLKARLLRMIVSNEQTRKAAADEARNGR
ncbi:MAG: hypothetical protein JNL18_09100 [Planctomycetaceae bacterium]|uniref:Uncharacterized protein n=1 Tax=Lacipirellula limnantheis TaxID=2528024 RepID=A0A517U167_9BACT|nr:hypothetical protein [Lacipirellula limnantheis]MBL9162876.1 hypothetical protein [Planctomycetaceae bacterium]QDT74376.1 hypothetical protein I41_35710 [Lacipirellula limnantheis]